MEKITVVNSVAVPWLMPDVDTDIITPMRRILLNMDELEVYSFEAFRFLGGDAERGGLNPEFPLNQPKYRNAKIMIVGENFGCGSSRETAAEAIRRCGYSCLIGSSFANIFFKNCCQQGVLPVVLPKETVEDMAKQAEAGGIFEVNLQECYVQSPDGKKHTFSIQESRRQGLLQGLDDVGVTLMKKDQIDEFYRRDKERRPWLYQNTEERCAECS